MKNYYLGLYEKSMPNTLTLEEKLRQAKAAGFDFMEISIDETDAKLSRLDMTREERKALVDAMYQAGLPIKTMCLSGHRKYPLGSRDESVLFLIHISAERALNPFFGGALALCVRRLPAKRPVKPMKFCRAANGLGRRSENHDEIYFCNRRRCLRFRQGDYRRVLGAAAKGQRAPGGGPEAGSLY